MFAGAIALAAFIISATSVRAAAATVPLSGWAWSSTVGWVDLGGVSVDTGTGVFSGYGWSSNIGWVSFNAADVSGCPGGSCTPTVNPTDGTITGFIRACAGTVSGNCQGLSRTDGWDGWIELSGTNHISPDTTGAGGVSYDPVAKKIVGYAWGSEVIGWLNFVNVSAPLDGNVCTNGATNFPTCTTCPPGAVMNAGGICAPASVTLSASTAPACGTPVHLSWTTSSTATSYRISRSSVSASSGFTDMTSQTATSYDDNALASSTTYYYKVVAVNSLGDSDPSPVKSVISSDSCPSTSCTLDGVTVASGDSRTYYNSVAGGVCSKDLTCNNGTFSPTPGTFDLSAPGPSCTATGTVPTITSFKMSPDDTVNAGQSCTMVWTSTGADSCTIKGNGLGAAGTDASPVSGGSMPTPLMSTTTGASPYTITCTNSAGVSLPKTAICRLNAVVHEN